MSGAGSLPDSDEALTALAGEYVLGTLPRDEAARVEVEAEGDPALAGAIADWESRLVPLLSVVAAVAPPAGLWPRIAATAFAGADPRPGRGTAIGDRRTVLLLRSLPLWRGIAAAGLLAAAASGIALSIRPPAGVPVAVLAPVGTASPAFVLEAARDGSLGVVPIHPAPVPAGRDLELWSLAEGAKLPKPLGLLPAGGTRLPADRLPAGPAQILVSLEPAGGSPTGLPTGPVLYGAAIGRP